MTNAISVSITADVADLVAKRAIMSTELRAASKDLTDFAKAAKSGGMTDELRTSMLGAADAVSKSRAQISGVDKDLKRLNTSGREAGAGVEVAGHHLQNFGFQANDMVVGLMSGQKPLTVFIQQGSQIKQIADQAGVGVGTLTKSFFDQVRTSPLVSAALSPIGVTTALVGGTALAAAAATMQYDERLQGLRATALGVGAVSGLTAQQLEAAGEAAARYGDQSSSASVASAEAFAAAGVKSQAAITALASDVAMYAKLTGQDAADAQKELATAMQDPVHGAEVLNERLSILDATQVEQIRTLVANGEQQKAVAVLMAALRQRTDDARASGVQAVSAWGAMTNQLSNMWTWLGRVNQQLAIFATYGSGASEWADSQKGTQNAVAAAAQRAAALKNASAGGQAVIDRTPEGQDRSKLRTLQGDYAALQKAMAANKTLYGENSAAYRDSAAAAGEYKRAIDSFLPSAEKAHRIAQLDDQISDARQKRDKAKVQSLSEEKARVTAAGEVKSSADVDRAAADAGAKGLSNMPGPKKGAKGPGVVAEWTQDLREQQRASQNFFGDQTAAELKFWQSKVGLTKQGSREWREVQGHIYDAQKTLARQEYDDHIADLNDKMAADRDNWSKIQADWQEKLTFIASKFGEESKEYKDANRQFVTEERRHSAEMEQARRESAERKLADTRQHLSALRAIREQDAASAEALTRDQASGQPLGDIEAAQRIAQMHQQLNEQELRDLDTLYASQSQMLSQDFAKAASRYTMDSAQYIAALDAKKAADRQYFDEKSALEHRAMGQSIQDILSMKQAYNGYISGMAGATTSGLLGVLTRTQTFGQGVRGVYNSLLGSVNQILQQMLTRWIVQHVLMSGAQRAQLAIQTATHVAAEGAKTAATVGATSAQTGAEIAAATTAAVAQKAIAIQQAISLVGLAGAGGVASMAAAPFPINLTAPAFGAAMAASATSFAALASFDKGADVLPADMIAQVHAGERIIPAADNRAIISALNGRGPNGDRSSSFNAHYAPVINAGGGQSDIMRELDGRSSHFFRWLSQAHRDGKFSLG